MFAKEAPKPQSAPSECKTGQNQFCHLETDKKHLYPLIPIPPLWPFLFVTHCVKSPLVAKILSEDSSAAGNSYV